MVRWSELERQQPRFAALGRERLIEPGVVLVGTIRRDGTPRISPVEPLLWDGEFWLSMLYGSLKAADLFRDSRVLVHGIVTSRDGAAGEYKVRGRAMMEDSLDRQRGYANEVTARIGWTPDPGHFHLFKVDIADVTFIRYEETGDQFVARWPDAIEFVRRGTSATSLGPREPRHEFLDP
jgi:Pyridoxamine 5'-phosphate oxidase